MRQRYVLYSNSSSSRDIELDCDFTPGKLTQSYSVLWQSRMEETLLFNDVADSNGYYNFSVNTSPSSQLEYLCQIHIRHRNDTDDTEEYNGPVITIEKHGEVVVMTDQLMC